MKANFPSQVRYRSSLGHVEEISISGLDEPFTSLKTIPYAETYKMLCNKGAFNMRLIDDALVRFHYQFCQDRLIKHNLYFFPSPDLGEYQNNLEVYGTDALYAEVVMKDVVTTPIRFDFDTTAFSDYIHPMSHFTVGQYRNCRIPVLGALTPYRFLNVVLRAFYNTPYQKYCSDWKASAPDFEPSITDRERSDLHWSFG